MTHFKVSDGEGDCSSSGNIQLLAICCKHWASYLSKGLVGIFCSGFLPHILPYDRYSRSGINQHGRRVSSYCSIMNKTEFTAAVFTPVWVRPDLRLVESRPRWGQLCLMCLRPRQLQQTMSALSQVTGEPQSPRPWAPHRREISSDSSRTFCVSSSTLASLATAFTTSLSSATAGSLHGLVSSLCATFSGHSPLPHAVQLAPRWRRDWEAPLSSGATEQRRTGFHG